jgi:hypothetical protein
MLVFQIIFILILFVLFLLVFYLSGKHPRNDRDWSENQAVLPFAEFRKNGKVFIKNIRHCSYKTANDYSVSYYDREYDINRLKKVWFLLVHFTGWKGAAHAFVSFEFEDETFVSVSVEQRRQKGESFSAFKGLFRQFELMYVIADERDTILLRTEHHKNNIFLYPLKLSKEKEKELFCDILKRANALAKNPEFYHSITNACFGNIVDHINNILPKKMPFDYRIILPENADFYAHELDLLDTELSPKEARKKHLINSLAKKYANGPNFSLRIRGK